MAKPRICHPPESNSKSQVLTASYRFFIHPLFSNCFPCISSQRWPSLTKRVENWACLRLPVRWAPCDANFKRALCGKIVGHVANGFNMRRCDQYCMVFGFEF